MLVLDENCKYSGAKVVDPYDCTLNQTDLKTNKNKFYIMQVIKNGNDHYLFIRYGRIGEIGRISHIPGSFLECVNKFVTQFKSKTKNSWDSVAKDHCNFQQYSGKYYLCQKQEIKDESIIIADEKKIISKLDKRVQSFMNLIGNLDMLQTTLKSLDIDTKKMPLGAIKLEQLEKAEQILAEIEKELSSPPTSEIFLNLSSQYYTYVPQVVGRSSKPKLINNTDIIKNYLEKIEDLKNLKIAYTTIESSANINSDIHPADDLYSKVRTEIKAVDENSDVWKVIQEYIQNTQGATHHSHGELVDIYEIMREDERERQKELDAVGNVHLLWHGTRLSNYISILKLGLVLRPELVSNAKITGKMFSNGIYFANSYSKSQNYCGVYSGDEACLFLAEVALGNPSKRINADYHITHDKLKATGHNSCWGQGKFTPTSQTKLIVDGNREVIVPNGKLGHSTLSNPSLLYDEFIVYKENQLRLRYIVRVKIK